MVDVHTATQGAEVAGPSQSDVRSHILNARKARQEAAAFRSPPLNGPAGKDSTLDGRSRTAATEDGHLVNGDGSDSHCLSWFAESADAESGDSALEEEISGSSYIDHRGPSQNGHQMGRSQGSNGPSSPTSVESQTESGDNTAASLMRPASPEGSHNHEPTGGMKPTKAKARKAPAEAMWMTGRSSLLVPSSPSLIDGSGAESPSSMGESVEGGSSIAGPPGVDAHREGTQEETPDINPRSSSLKSSRHMTPSSARTSQSSGASSSAPRSQPTKGPFVKESQQLLPSPNTPSYRRISASSSRSIGSSNGARSPAPGPPPNMPLPELPPGSVLSDRSLSQQSAIRRRSSTPSMAAASRRPSAAPSPIAEDERHAHDQALTMAHSYSQTSSDDHSNGRRSSSGSDRPVETPTFREQTLQEILEQSEGRRKLVASAMSNARPMSIRSATVDVDFWSMVNPSTEDLGTASDKDRAAQASSSHDEETEDEEDALRSATPTQETLARPPGQGDHLMTWPNNSFVAVGEIEHLPAEPAWSIDAPSVNDAASGKSMSTRAGLDDQGKDGSSEDESTTASGSGSSSESGFEGSLRAPPQKKKRRQKSSSRSRYGFEAQRAAAPTIAVQRPAFGVPQGFSPGDIIRKKESPKPEAEAEQGHDPYAYYSFSPDLPPFVPHGLRPTDLTGRGTWMSIAARSGLLSPPLSRTSSFTTLQGRPGSSAGQSVAPESPTSPTGPVSMRQIAAEARAKQKLARQFTKRQAQLMAQRSYQPDNIHALASEQLTQFAVANGHSRHLSLRSQTSSKYGNGVPLPGSIRESPSPEPNDSSPYASLYRALSLSGPPSHLSEAGVGTAAPVKQYREFSQQTSPPASPEPFQRAKEVRHAGVGMADDEEAVAQAGVEESGGVGSDVCRLRRIGRVISTGWTSEDEDENDGDDAEQDESSSMMKTHPSQTLMATPRKRLQKRESSLSLRMSTVKIDDEDDSWPTRCQMYTPRLGSRASNAGISVGAGSLRTASRNSTLSLSDSDSSNASTVDGGQGARAHADGDEGSGSDTESGESDLDVSTPAKDVASRVEAFDALAHSRGSKRKLKEQRAASSMARRVAPGSERDIAGTSRLNARRPSSTAASDSILEGQEFAGPPAETLSANSKPALRAAPPQLQSPWRLRLPSSGQSYSEQASSRTSSPASMTPKRMLRARPDSPDLESTFSRDDSEGNRADSEDDEDEDDNVSLMLSELDFPAPAKRTSAMPPLASRSVAAPSPLSPRIERPLSDEQEREVSSSPRQADEATGLSATATDAESVMSYHDTVEVLPEEVSRTPEQTTSQGSDSMPVTLDSFESRVPSSTSSSNNSLSTDLSSAALDGLKRGNRDSSNTAATSSSWTSSRPADAPDPSNAAPGQIEGLDANNAEHKVDEGADRYADFDAVPATSNELSEVTATADEPATSKTSSEETLEAAGATLQGLDPSASLSAPLSANSKPAQPRASMPVGGLRTPTAIRRPSVPVGSSSPHGEVISSSLARPSSLAGSVSTTPRSTPQATPKGLRLPSNLRSPSDRLRSPSSSSMLASPRGGTLHRSASGNSLSQPQKAGAVHDGTRIASASYGFVKKPATPSTPPTAAAPASAPTRTIGRKPSGLPVAASRGKA
ncbi:unnamed protein product [Jaminaea pallidilutea]